MLYLSVKCQVLTKTMISDTDSYLSYITGIENKYTHNPSLLQEMKTVPIFLGPNEA